MEIFVLGGNDPSIFAEGLVGSNEMRGVALENTYDTSCRFSRFAFRLDPDHHMIAVHGFVHVAGIDINIVFPMLLVGNDESESVRVAMQFSGDQMHFVGKPVASSTDFYQSALAGHFLDVVAKLPLLSFGHAQQPGKLRDLHGARNFLFYQ